MQLPTLNSEEEAPRKPVSDEEQVRRLLMSDDPRIWKRLSY